MKRCGNRYAYTNRLRLPRYQSLFESAGWHVERELASVSKAAIETLSHIPIHADFSGFSPETLCTRLIRFVLVRSTECVSHDRSGSTLACCFASFLQLQDDFSPSPKRFSLFDSFCIICKHAQIGPGGLTIINYEFLGMLINHYFNLYLNSQCLKTIPTLEGQCVNSNK